MIDNLCIPLSRLVYCYAPRVHTARAACVNVVIWFSMQGEKLRFLKFLHRPVCSFTGYYVEWGMSDS